MNIRTEVTAELGIAFRDGLIVHEDGFAKLTLGEVLGVDVQEGILLLRHGDTLCL